MMAALSNYTFLVKTNYSRHRVIGKRLCILALKICMTCSLSFSCTSQLFSILFRKRLFYGFIQWLTVAVQQNYIIFCSIDYFLSYFDSEKHFSLLRTSISSTFHSFPHPRQADNLYQHTFNLHCQCFGSGFSCWPFFILRLIFAVLAMEENKSSLSNVKHLRRDKPIMYPVRAWPTRSIIKFSKVQYAWVQSRLFEMLETVQAFFVYVSYSWACNHDCFLFKTTFACWSRLMIYTNKSSRWVLAGRRKILSWHIVAGKIALPTEDMVV